MVHSGFCPRTGAQGTCPIQLRSLSPIERWFPNRAWSFRVGYERAKEFACEGWRCGIGFLQGGLGASTLFGPLQVFALAEIDGQVGGVF